VSNVQYERTAALITAESFSRLADLAHEYGEHSDEAIYRDGAARRRQLAEHLRRALLNGK